MEEIFYRADGDDYLAANRFWFLKRQLRWYFYIGIPLIALTCILLWKIKFAVVLFGIGTYSFAIFFYLFVVIPLYSRRSFRAIPKTYTGTKLRFDVGVLEHESAVGSGHLSWLHDVIPGKNVILLLVGTNVYMPVPVRAFKDVAQMERFVAVTRGLVEKRFLPEGGAVSHPAE